jgi:ubiquinone/menaquinone biosynthesis C-methylase UbiE
MEKFLNPTEILKKLELHREMIAVDFGSGSGGWSIPLAKKLEDGKIYAIDLLQEPLSVLRSRAKLEKVSNIQTIQTNIEDETGFRLPDSSIDLILMTNLLFQVRERKGVFGKAKKMLKSGGRILVVDWKPDSPQGPEEGRVSEKEVENLAEESGLKLEKEFEAGIYHYGLVFKKP